MDNQIENQVEIQPQNKKKGKGLIPLVVILVLLVLGLSGYIVYDKVFNKETNELEKTETKEETVKSENLDVSSNEVITLFNEVNNLSKNSHSDAYYGYLYKQDKLDIKDMSDDLIIAVGIYDEHVNCLNNYDSCLQTTPGNEVGYFVIEGTKVQNNIKKIFGDINYNNVKINNLDCTGDYEYDNNSKLYKATAPACGYAGDGNLLETRIVKAVKNSNSIDIYVKVAFEHYILESDANGNDTSMRYVYSDLGQKNEVYKIKQIEYDFNTILETYGDKLDTYKLHFENENGEYHFKSVVKQ